MLYSTQYFKLYIIMYKNERSSKKYTINGLKNVTPVNHKYRVYIPNSIVCDK